MEEKPRNPKDDRTVDLEGDPPGPPRDEPSSLPPQLGHYRIVGELGRGGMGVVYLAEDERLRRRVALKVLPERLARDPRALERFAGEARNLVALNHPNIATIHSLEDIDGIRFLTMELIPGIDLGQRLAEGPLPIDELLALSRQIAAGLQAAHQQGIVHRDLKPTNVMLAAENRVKIVDFGLATALAGVDGNPAPHSSGTLGYMSPEQLRGEEFDLRTDIWAFGCVLFECLAGVSPFEGANVTERIKATLAHDPDWTRLPDETPPALRALVESCLQKSPDNRAENFADLRRRIEELFASRTLQFARPPGVERIEHPNNLPLPLGVFIGREKQREEIRDLLRHHRLVTLTGFGGTGKTRLAIEVARDLLGIHPDGTWFVELAPLTRPELLAQTVASVAGLRYPPQQTPTEALIAAWRDRALLLILDNCEHLVAAAADLTKTLLASISDLRILATSREALGMFGEVQYPIPALALPRTASIPLEDLREIEAVRLFVNRAQCAKHDFALTAENAPAVIDICRRLDGIALAIELAAARISALPPAVVAERLEHRFRLLRGGDRTALPHHQTLRAMVDWSYDQLEEPERAVLRRLSVFAGGWSLDAAEAVCAGDPIEDWEVLDHLFRLVERSWVETDAEEAEKGGRTRYRMLEIVREYGRERLAEAGEDESVLHRHRSWCVHFLDREAGQVAPPDWFQQLEGDHDNFRLALETCLRERDDGGLGLLIGFRLSRFWETYGYHREGLRSLQAVLSADSTRPVTSQRVGVLLAAGNLAVLQNDHGTARSLYEEAVTICKKIGEPASMSRALGNLATIAQYEGDLEHARKVFLDILQLSRERSDRRDELVSLICLGSVEGELKLHAEANRRLEAAIQLARETEERSLEGFALSNLAVIYNDTDRHEQSILHGQRALDIFREIGAKSKQAIDLVNLASNHVTLGGWDAARNCLEEAVGLMRECGKNRATATAIAAFGRLAWARGKVVECVSLMSASRSVRLDLGEHPSDRPEDRWRVEAQGKLGEEAYEAAWAHGQSMDWMAALEYGMSVGRA